MFPDAVRNSRITSALAQWAEQDSRGIALDSSGGFVLPNGARRSASASWTINARVHALPPEDQNRYWRLCPNFVIELKSQGRWAQAVQKKMEEYLANGAQLGWLIDPETRAVTIYRPGRDPEVLASPESVRGEGPVDGFVLDLRRIWDPLTPAA